MVHKRYIFRLWLRTDEADEALQNLTQVQLLTEIKPCITLWVIFVNRQAEAN